MSGENIERPASPPVSPPPAPRAPQRSGGGVLWPVLLITVGALFLASNLGYLGAISFVELLRLWPVLLVLAGIDLAIAKRYPLAAVVIDVFVIAGVLLFAMSTPSNALFGPRGDQSAETRILVQRDAARTLELRMAGGAARYTISGGATALVEVTSDRNNLRLVDDQRNGETATVRIEQRDDPLSFAGGPTNVDVRIANDVALTLRFDAGAGDFTVDLSALNAKSVRLAVGAASMRVVLPKPNGDVPVRIDGGASSITIEAPENVEARVSANGLVSTRSLTSRFTVNDKVVESTGYATARDRVTVTVNAGASSITVR